AAIPGPPVREDLKKARDEALARSHKQIEAWRKNGQWDEMYLTKGIPEEWRKRLLPLTRTAKWWETRFSPIPADYDEPLKPLKVPVTAVVAIQETNPARDGYIDKLFASMPNVKVMKIEARHDFHEDRPELVIEVIR